MEANSKANINKIFGKLEEFLSKYGLYILALGVAILNISLMFDNVVWGDEAYSEMAIRHADLYGIYQRVYYWDSHPPLYYYYLRLFADVLGYKTWVYHLASIVPFLGGLALSLTTFKKRLGAVPVAFFIILTGLSESCAEYNQEIRMYSLAFFLTMLTAYYGLLILNGESKIRYFVLMTLFGIMSAYTHYFGLATCGLLIFFTGLMFFIKNRKDISLSKRLLPWIISVVVYIVTYIPWLFVLYFQTQAELGNSWMAEPEALSKILKFMTCGDKLEFFVLPFIIITSLWILVKDIKKKSLSKDGTVLIVYWGSIVGVLAFSYAVSYLFHPMLAFRYVYVLIPLVLLIFMIGMKNVIEYIHEENTKENIRTVLYTLCVVLFLVMTLLSLLDFKYFRSVTKTQNVETNKILNIVGVPDPNTVICSNGVKHLSWTVLSYYYDSEITTWNPWDVPDKLGMWPSDYWCFNGYPYDDDAKNKMANMGYANEEYPDMWMGKYNVWVTHFYNY